MSVPIHKKQEIKYKHSIRDIFFRIIILYSSASLRSYDAEL